ncbi:MAG: hypothetical protein ACKVHE_34225 [Planctomycetales bacterium]
MTKAISQEWLDVSERFPEIAARCGDAVYTIPKKLVYAIHSAVPKLFSPDELSFETHLAETGVTGFFLNQPFRYPILSQLASDSPEQTDSSIDDQIRELLVDEAREIGRNSSAVDSYLKEVAQRNKTTQLRQAGYVGWLISEPTYRTEMDVFISKWKRTIARNGRFTAVRKSLLGERTRIHKRSRECWSDSMLLYRRWGLETCVTWDLPVPLYPGLESRNFYMRSDIEEAGLHVFIPLYLLRDRDLSVYEIVKTQRCLTDDAHLADWLEHRSSNWGYERYAQMLELYVYLELALRRRYGDRLRGQAGRLDEAFTRFWLESEDGLQVFTRKESTTKTRQQLGRRLKACGEQS